MPIITKVFGNFKHSSKIAAFDYDWTLVKPTGKRIHPKDANDWEWRFTQVPTILETLHALGYSIYVFTNQSNVMKLQHIENSLSTLSVPFFVSIAFEGFYKPNPKMFNDIIKSSEWNRDLSFYTGDALGRDGDYSNVDLEFANNVGINLTEPEVLFAMTRKQLECRLFVQSTTLSDQLPNVHYEAKKKESKSSERQQLAVLKDRPYQEIVILTGYQGSGKSTVSNLVFNNDRYVILHRDDIRPPKQVEKMVKMATAALQSGKSVVFDATNPSKSSRKTFIDLAQAMGIPSRCVYVSTSLETSMRRNKSREKPVPAVALYTFRKAFERPTPDEGCDVEICEIVEIDEKLVATLVSA